MSSNLIQPALSAGELSHNLFARVDLERYQTGLALMRNFFVDYRGGGTYRAGTRLVGVALDSTQKVRLVRFSFNTDQNYVLEFGHNTIRFIRDGEYILDPTAKSITNVSVAAQCVITSNAHGYANGDQVFIVGTGFPQIDNRTFIVSDVTANTYKIKYLNGNYVNSTSFVSGGAISPQSNKLLTVATTYTGSVLFQLRFAQSADVMTITHPLFQQRELKRLAEDSWTLSVISFAATISAPAAPTLTATSSGKCKYAYKITAVNDKGEESVGSTAGTIDHVVNIAATAGTIKAVWAAVTGADHYKVYKANPITSGGFGFDSGTQFGFIGDTSSLQFLDTNILPDFTRTPPKQLNPFSGTRWPACVSYYQQRIVYAGSNSAPETLNFSQTGQFKNFDESIPVKDDDAIEATVASLEINRIKYMVSMPGGLLILTSGAIFQINGGSADAAITPAQISVTVQSYNGCGDIAPIVIDYNVLYVQSQNSILRALQYNFYTNAYVPQDVSLFSQHFFKGFSMVDWTWCEEPDRLIWLARSDGYMISLTYVPDQKINGMALSSTQGYIESVTSVQENNENALYMVVKRKINNVDYRFTERMASRSYSYGIEDSWNLDCALERGLTTSLFGVRPTAKTGTNVLWQASGAAFASGDVGKTLRAGGGIATIVSFVSNSQVRADFVRDVQDVIPETDTPPTFAAGTWTMDSNINAITYGLEHLETATVNVLADGVDYEGLVVTNGGVTLPGGVLASKFVIGLGYEGLLKTLPIETGSTPTAQGKRKNIHAVTLRVDKARGLEIGSTEATLRPVKIPNWQDDGQLMTGDMRMVTDPNWQELGQYYVRQTKPYAATVLGFIPELSVGDTGK